MATPGMRPASAARQAAISPSDAIGATTAPMAGPTNGTIDGSHTISSPAATDPSSENGWRPNSRSPSRNQVIPSRAARILILMVDICAANFRLGTLDPGQLGLPDPTPQHPFEPGRIVWLQQR